MELPPANLCRHFLPWDRPLLPQVVAWLAQDWRGDGPLDLSETLAIVPTRQAGRRLREALAAHAATKGAAVFPPRVLLPDSLLAPAEAGRGVATRLDALLAWADVFRGIELDAFRQVFPVDPPARTQAWALRLAQEFVRLQHALAESGWRMADVPRLAGADFPEAARWAQLAELERRQDARLATAQRREPHAARVAADGAKALAGVRRIVLLGTPAPLPLALDVIARGADARPIEVVVLAPPELAAAFDAWGRPDPAVWQARTIELPAFAERVHLCSDPAAQAERVASLTSRYKEPEGVLGVGVADPEILPRLENELGPAGQPGFNPEGRRRAGDALHQLASALAALASEESFAAVAALARCPDFLTYLQTRLGEAFTGAKYLRELDWLHARHLPPTLTEARNHVMPDGVAVQALAVVAELSETLRAGVFPTNAAAAFAAIFAGRRFALSDPREAAASEAAGAWSEVLREIAASAEHFGRLSDADGWELALRLYGESVRYDEKPAGAVELQGWLELLWEDAPHLVVAGLNDGRVPDAVAGDPFLPESLRERLGLKTNSARFARDAYLLEALANSRATGGRLDVLLGKVSAAGDPLRPSRLLLRCAEAELPARVGRLFREVAPTRAAPAWRRSWQLEPPVLEPPTKVAVTGVRAWLACPFRFYLQRIVKMEPVDPAKTELAATDFGTLCHAALEAMGREPALRDCTDAETLRRFLLDALERAARRQFGAELTLPLLVQLESARQRLRRVADIQTETRAAGWVIEAIERPFEIEIAGLKVSGKIDRIDRHESTGARRVLDYKTSDKAVDPAAAHYRNARREETAPEFARFDLDGKLRVWTDLQLPLYRRAVGGADLGCAYFNLPKAAGETGLREWPDFTPELDAAAWRCAEGVASAIRGGVFWPPNEAIKADYDDFAALFHRGAAASIAWKGAVAP